MSRFATTGSHFPQDLGTGSSEGIEEKVTHDPRECGVLRCFCGSFGIADHDAQTFGVYVFIQNTSISRGGKSSHSSGLGQICLGCGEVVLEVVKTDHRRLDLSGQRGCHPLLPVVALSVYTRSSHPASTQVRVGGAERKGGIDIRESFKTQPRIRVAISTLAPDNAVIAQLIIL